MAADKILELIAKNLPYPQLNNQWVFRELDSSVSENQVIEYAVKSIEVPGLFPTLNTEKLPTGVSYYTSVEWDREWSLTFEEDTSMRVYDYFAKWKSSVFDSKKHCFNLEGGNYVKEFLIYLKRPAVPSLGASLAGDILKNSAKSASANILNSAIGRLVNKANSLVSDSLTEGGANITLVGRSISSMLDKTAGAVQGMIEGGFNSLLTDLNSHDDEISFVLDIRGAMIKSIDKISLDYEDGQPVTWKVSLTCDEVLIT